MDNLKLIPSHNELVTKPTRKIKCGKCKRNVSAVILKQYSVMDKNDLDYDIHFQVLLIKDHRKSFWTSRHCSNSGRKIRKRVGYTTPQAG